MLASLAALQLVILTQAPGAPPRGVPPGALAQQTTPEGESPPPNPPLPSKPGRKRPSATPGAQSAPAQPEAEPPPSTPPTDSTPPSTPTPPSTSTPPSTPTPPSTSTSTSGSAPRQLSLLSGDSLGGGSAALAWAGWSSLGVMYGQGVNATDDLMGVLEFDWAYTEFRLGGIYRRPLGKAGGFDLAARLGASWYKDAGWPWVHSSNRTDHGLELAPGASLSSRSESGILSVLVEAPLTITMKYDGGLIFRPRLSVAYEAPIYSDLSVGARAGIGYRAGSGDAPLKAGRADLTFVLLAGYQLL